MDVIKPVKFLYASDLRLDKPLMLEEGSGISPVQARDAAYEAVRRLLDCALSREVDFVFLRGEIFDARHGAKAPVFLAEQLARLSNAGIGCFILNEGTAPDSRWFTELPSGVKWFSRRSELEKSGLITCVTREMSLASLLDPAPPPLLGAGAWLVSMPDTGEAAPEKCEKELIEFNTLRLERGEPGAAQVETRDADQGRSGLEEDFWSEVDFFKSGIDLRVGLLDALKERGLYKHVLAADAALLENMTEADAESILNEACGIAKSWFSKNEARQG